MTNPFLNPTRLAAPATTPTSTPNPFGGPGIYPSPIAAPPSPATQAQPNPEPPQRPGGRRRFSVGAASSSAASTRAKGLEVPNEPLVEGTFRCYVSGFSHYPDGSGMSVKLAIHAPGTALHGVEINKISSGPYAKKGEKPSAGAMRMHIKKTIGLFAKSGFPQTKWDSDAAGNKIPPIHKWWVVTATSGDGQSFTVPVMLEGVFGVDRKEGQSPLEGYQRVDSVRPIGFDTGDYIIAPVPKFVAGWRAVECGWPGEVRTSDGGNDYYMVDTDSLYASDTIFNRNEWGRSLSGEASPHEFTWNVG